MTRTASGIAGFDGLMATSRGSLPLHRPVTPEDIGALTAFLCTSGSSGMTGQTIDVCHAGAHIVRLTEAKFTAEAGKNGDAQGKAMHIHAFPPRAWCLPCRRGAPHNPTAKFGAQDGRTS